MDWDEETEFRFRSIRCAGTEFKHGSKYILWDMGSLSSHSISLTNRELFFAGYNLGLPLFLAALTSAFGGLLFYGATHLVGYISGWDVGLVARIVFGLFFLLFMYGTYSDYIKENTPLHLMKKQLVKLWEDDEDWKLMKEEDWPAFSQGLKPEQKA